MLIVYFRKLGFIIGNMEVFNLTDLCLKTFTFDFFNGKMYNGRVFVMLET